MNLYYVTQGDSQNPPLVLLHGFLANHKDWQETVKTFKENYYCIVIDLPGHGGSVINESNDSFEGCAAQINAILDSLNLECCHLLGYSMGGRIALYTILSYPDRFQSFIMEGSCPGLKTKEEQEERVKQDAYIAKRIEKEKNNFRGYLDKWYEQPFFKSLKDDPVKYEFFLESRLENNPMQVAYALRVFGIGAQISLWERLAEVKVPVCLIVGEDDSKFYCFAEDMKKRFKQAELYVISVCGHNVHIEKTEEYVRILSNFLKKGQNE
jgi:2-succinyl-6-hydroxy-2,4-cyclohexadiene-1-carboxylate synthase